MKVIGWIVLAIVVACGGSIVFGRLRWRSAANAAVARLGASRAAPGGATYTEAELKGLPAPVIRYFRAVLREGQPIIATAHFAQQGDFRMGEAEDSWRPFDATEDFVSRPPGFVWLARVRMAPGLGVDVRDSYLDGAGSMRASIFGLVTLADAHDTPEMAAGAMQRYLAEAPWFPTALLPSQGAQWTPIDDSTARASLTDGKTTVSMDYHFNERGEITSAFTAERYREVKGRYEPAPWGGMFTEYADRGGVRIPLAADVAWVLDGKRFSYWRGRTTQVEYNRVP
jgi:hypothetical protein